jgi:DNA-binding NarL/FixJ family response regulator
MRVLLLEVPQLLRGILEHAIRQRSDCELLKSAGRDFELGTERTVLPDAVILGLSAADDSTLVPGLFARWPSAQVMTVMQAGDSAAVYEMRPRRRLLGQVSPTELLDALRDAVRRHRDLTQQKEE